MLKSPRNARVRWIVVAGLALAALLFLAVLLRPAAIQVEAATVVRGPIDETVSDQGQARARQAYVVAAPVSGEVERLPVEVGDAVVANRTIVARVLPSPTALLDSRARAQAEAAIRAAQAVLDGATAQRASAAAEAARAESEFERTAPLAPSGVVSRQQADNVRASADVARRALEAADEMLKQRGAELASAQAVLAGPGAPAGAELAITSPASGYVTHLPQQSQRIVAEGTPLVEISDRHGLEAAIEFLSQDAVKVHAGDQAEIYDWGGARPIAARVRLVEPQGYTKVSALGVEEQRVRVMLQFEGDPNSWAGLQPGYRVWGRVFLRRVADAILAPTGALVRNGSNWAVFRIEQGKARLRPVGVGVITDQSAEVTSGLSVGDRVVDFPSDRVADGTRVKGS